MEPKIALVLPASLLDTLRGAGFPTQVRGLAHCPVQVGDVMSHPACPGMAVKVVGRYLRLAHQDQPEAWYLYLEQAEAQLDRKAPRPPLP